MSEPKWMLLKVPGVGDVICWADDSLFAERGMVEVESVTRIVPNPSGQVGLVKLAERLTFNLMAIPLWMDAPTELINDVSKRWDRIIVPQKRILPHD